MHYLVVSDIFGRTNALEAIASELPGSTDIIDPYNSIKMNFKNEAEAYGHFIAEVGMEMYAENLKDFIENISENIIIIGFSIGASAVWKISSQIEPCNIASAICFYGSQIRYEKDVCPRFPVDLIFPASEEHYSVSNLITYLSGRDNLQIHQVAFFHGFMNIHSKNYDHAGYNQLMQTLCKSPL